VRQVPYEGAVEQFAAGCADPTFYDRIHARRPDGAAHGSDARVGKDLVE
jgi:hypothetical protein